MKPRATIGPKLTVRQAELLARACGGGGEVIYTHDPKGGPLENLKARDALMRLGLLSVADEGGEPTSRVCRVVATPLGRWRALGGKPPKDGT